MTTEKLSAEDACMALYFLDNKSLDSWCDFETRRSALMAIPEYRVWEYAVQAEKTLRDALRKKLEQIQEEGEA